jgi:2'-5' RNA ligase superfamily
VVSPRGGYCFWGRHNSVPGTVSLRYALVAYVSGPAGAVVEGLRRELHPDLSHFAAHLTILPPRILQGSEGAALETLERICGDEEPFEVGLGGVDTFAPTTPTVFIRVESGAIRMVQLHDRLNTGPLMFREEWPYIPHLTIVKMTGEPAARSACQTAAERWQQFAGSRRIVLEKLMFVREDAQNCWVDLAPVLLGRRLVSR